MAFRFHSLIALLLLLVSDAVALKSEVDTDRPHKEISPPVVLYKAANDDEEAAGSEEASTDDDAAKDEEKKDEEKSDDEEKKDDEKKDEDKDAEKEEKDAEKEEKDEEATEAPEEEEATTAVPEDHIHLPPAAAAFFGPGGCVATFRSPSGTCVMQTRCKGQEVPESYEYGLTCVDDKGVSTRHLFGAGSFDSVETFDTLIQCDLCLGVDGQKATPEMKELADDVLGLEGEMAVLKDDVKLIKDHLDLGKKDEEKKDEEKSDDDEKKDDEKKDEEKSEDKADEPAAEPADEPADDAKTLFLRGKSVQQKVAVAPAHHAHRRAVPGKNHPVASLHSHIDSDDRH